MRRYVHQSYEQYKAAQLRKYEKKKHVIFAAPEEMVKVAELVRRHVQNPSFGICHGVRTGYEVWMLRKLLGIEVIGTDIANVERPYGGVTVVCWDFHNRNPEWVGRASFVYSNSWDHSYNPQLMLQTWMEQLRRVKTDESGVGQSGSPDRSLLRARLDIAQPLHRSS